MSLNSPEWATRSRAAWKADTLGVQAPTAYLDMSDSVESDNSHSGFSAPPRDTYRRQAMCLEMKHGDWIGETLGEARAHLGDKLVLSDGYAEGTVFPDNTCCCPVDLRKTAAKMGGGWWGNMGLYYEYFPEGCKVVVEVSRPDSEDIGGGSANIGDAGSAG